MPPNKKRRVCVEEEFPTDCPPLPANKRRKLENQQPHRTPSSFWDNLSRQWLTTRALREFDRRTVPSIAPEPPNRTRKKDIDLAQLKRFARQGGPGLNDLRNYPESESATFLDRSMATTRSATRKQTQNPKKNPRRNPRKIPGKNPKKPAQNRGKSAQTGKKPTASAKTKTKKSGAYDPAFEQHLIDNGVYPNRYNKIKPLNLEEIKARLTRRRASLSPTRFTSEAFEEFTQENDIALTEADVMVRTITGAAKFRSHKNLCFRNLKNLTDGSIPKAKPDWYDGSHPDDCDPQIRKVLGRYISPSKEATAACVPNFFIEVKGPDGNSRVCHRQALYDGALGARGMAKLRAFVDPGTAYDSNAYVLTSTYECYSGMLKLYTHHYTRSTNPDREYDFHMTEIRAYPMASTLEDFQRGASALRHARDLARESREELITAANSRVPDADFSEWASPTPSVESLSSDENAPWETESVVVDEFAVD